MEIRTWPTQRPRLTKLSTKASLTGLVWLAHGVARTGLLQATWYAFLGQCLVVVPFLIVFLYALTIAVLERHWRRIQATGLTPD